MDEQIGTVEITSGDLLLIDPVYPQASGVGGLGFGTTVAIPAGEYLVLADSDFREITIVVSTAAAASRYHAGTVFVESGQIMILDTVNIAFYGGGEFDVPVAAAPAPLMDAYPFDFPGSCLAILSSRGGGELGDKEALAVRAACPSCTYSVIVAVDTEGSPTLITLRADTLPPVHVTV